jgi:hypothetical protein
MRQPNLEDEQEKKLSIRSDRGNFAAICSEPKL